MILEGSTSRRNCLTYGRVLRPALSPWPALGGSVPTVWQFLPVVKVPAAGRSVVAEMPSSVSVTPSALLSVVCRTFTNGEVPRLTLYAASMLALATLERVREVAGQ